MGFGHRVYKQADPRAAILEQYCQELSREVHEEHWEDIAATIERALATRKKLPPNVDWPSARLYHYLGLPPVRLYTPIFAMARVAGRLIASSRSTTIGSCGLAAVISGPPGAESAPKADDRSRREGSPCSPRPNGGVGRPSPNEPSNQSKTTRNRHDSGGPG